MLREENDGSEERRKTTIKLINIHTVTSLYGRRLGKRLHEIYLKSAFYYNFYAFVSSTE